MLMLNLKLNLKYETCLVKLLHFSNSEATLVSAKIFMPSSTEFQAKPSYGLLEGVERKSALALFVNRTNIDQVKSKNLFLFFCRLS